MEAEEGVGEKEGQRPGVGKGGADGEFLPCVRGRVKAEGGGHTLPVEEAEEDLQDREGGEHEEGGTVRGRGGQGCRHVGEEEGGLEKSENKARKRGEGSLVKETLGGGP